MKYSGPNFEICCCNDSNWGFSLLPFKKKDHLRSKSLPICWEQMVKMTADKCWGNKKKRKRTNFRVLQLKTVLHCRATSLESISKGAEQKSCERDCGNRLLHFKYCKVLQISKFHFTIKWLMQILLSLCVAIGTVSTLHVACCDLWLQVNYSRSTCQKCNKLLFPQT